MRVPPTCEQLRLAAAVLDELARAHRHAWSNPATREALAAVATWLERIGTPSSGSRTGSGRCDCGAALAHVADAGAAAVLCPSCDRDSLDEPGGPDEPDLEGELSLSVELARLGREAARDAWGEHAGELRAIPSYPELSAWRKLGAALGLLESDRVLDAGERRVFLQAYRNELRVLSVGAQ